MKTFEFENIKFLLGQNAQENWNILEKAEKINSDYIWFHLNSFPSSYVIMYSTLNELNDNSLNNYLNYGAQLCKNNSKYKNYNDLKICYTTLKNLSKTNKIGEVLIKGKRNIIKL
jgi:predicted ribosome quality control (RQC) complex YloA/Tae2 family protein